MKEKIKELNRLIEVVKKDQVMSKEYKIGMINGFEWSIATLEDKIAEFTNINDLVENGKS